MNINFNALTENISGLNDREKAILATYFHKSITYINSNYRNEEMYKKQLVVWMIKNLFKGIKLNDVESFVDDWFKRANLTTDEMIELKNSYFYYENDNQLYLGLAEKIMQEKKNNSSSGMFNSTISLFTL